MTVIGTAEIEVLANTSNFASGLKKGVIGVAAGALAGIGGTVAAGIKQFASFESGINEVFTLLGADAPQETLTAIEDQVKNLSQSFGLDLNDAIQGTYDSISAGVDPAATDSFNAFTETAAKFATAGATDFGTSVDLLTTATNAFGLNAADAEGTADVLFATIQGGKTTADELAASLFQVAPVASSAGVSLEEVSAGLATLTAQGVPTAQASTQLKAAFSELAKTGTKADQAFRDIAGQGFVQFLDQGGSVQEAFNLLRQSSDEAGVQVTDLFGSVEAGAAVLGTTGDQADRFAGNLENIEGAAGATQGAFDRMDEGIGAAFSRIKQTFAVALVDIGGAFAPFVSSVANVLQDQLPGIIDGLVGGFTAMANTVGPIFTDLALGVRAFFRSFSDPDVTSTGIVGLFEAFGATARRVFDGLNLGGIFDELFGDVNVGGGFTDIINQIIDTLVRLQPQIESVATSIGQILAVNAEVTRDIFTELAPIFLDLAESVLPVLADVLKIVAGALGVIVENTPAPVLLAAVAGFKALNTVLAVNRTLAAAGGLAGYLRQLNLVTAATRAWAGAQRAFQAAAAAGSFIRALTSNLIKYVRSVNLASVATKLWAGAQRLLNIAFLTSPIGIAVAAVAALTGAFIVAYNNSETFREGVQAVLEALSPLVDIAKLVGEAFQQLFTGDFSGAFDTLKDAGGALLDFFGDIGDQIGGLLVSGLQAVFDSLDLEAIGVPIDRIVQLFQLGFDQITGGFEIIFGGIRDLFSGNISEELFGGLLEGFASVMQGIGIVARTGIDLAIQIIQQAFRKIGLGFLADALEPIRTILFELTSGIVAFAGAFINAGDGITSSGFPGLMERFAILFRNIIDIVIELGGVIVDVFQGDFSSALEGLASIGDQILPLFAQLGELIGETLIFALTTALEAIGLGGVATAVEDGLRAVGDLIQTVAPPVFGFLAEAAEFAFDLVIDVVGVAIDVVGGLIDGAQAIWDTGILQFQFNLLVGAIEIAWDLISGFVRIGIATVGSLIDGAQALWDTGILQGAFSLLVAPIEIAWNLISGFVQIGIATVGSLIDAAQAIWDTGALQAIFGFLAGVIGDIWDDIETVVGLGIDAVGVVIDAAQAIWDTGILQEGFQQLRDAADEVWGALESIFQTAVDAVGAVIGTAQAVWDTGLIQEGFRIFGDTIEDVWGAIETVIETAVDQVGAVLGTIETVWNLPFVQAIFDGISAAFDLAWSAASRVIDEVVALIGGYFDAVQEVWQVAQIEGIFGAISEAWDQAWGLATDVIDAAVGLVEDALGFFGIGGEGGDSVGDQIGGVFDPVTDLWSGAFDGAVEAVSGWIDSLNDFLGDNFGINIGMPSIENLFNNLEAIWDASLGPVLDFIGEWISDLASDITDGLVAVLQPFIDFGTDLLDTFTGFFGDILTDVGDWLSDVRDDFELGLEVILEVVDAAWESIKDTIGGKAQEIIDDIELWFREQRANFEFGLEILRNIAENIWDQIRDGITARADAIREAVSSRIDAMRERVTSILSSLRDAAVDQFNTIRDRLTSIAQSLRDAVSAQIEALRLAVTTTLSTLRDSAIAQMTAIRDGLSNAANAAKDLVNSAFQALKDFISGLFDGISLGSINVSGILGPVEDIIDKVGDALGALGDLGRKIPGVSSGAGAIGSVARRLNPFAQGGLATEPGIVAEDFRPELVLPLTRPGRMKTLLGQFGPTLAQSVGGFDELVNVLSNGRDGSLAVLPPGPFPDSSAAPVGALSTAGGRSRTVIDNSVREYHFHGVQADELVRQTQIERKRDILEGLRVRG